MYYSAIERKLLRFSTVNKEKKVSLKLRELYIPVVFRIYFFCLFGENLFKHGQLYPSGPLFISLPVLNAKLPHMLWYILHFLIFQTKNVNMVTAGGRRAPGFPYCFV